jgi:hypothetical protein
MDEKIRIEGNGELRSKPWPRQYDNNPREWFELTGQIPKREWVGLTYGELAECQNNDPYRFYRAIEAKLKEKNT